MTDPGIHVIARDHIVRKNNQNSLSISEPSESKTCKCLSGIYLKYLLCKGLNLHRCLLLMWLFDPLIIAATSISLIPILQIDGTKIDIQVIVAIVKIIILCVGLKFNQNMVCMKKFRKNTRPLYLVRGLTFILCLIQDFVILYRKYHKGELQLFSNESVTSEPDEASDIYQDM